MSGGVKSGTAWQWPPNVPNKFVGWDITGRQLANKDGLDVIAGIESSIRDLLDVAPYVPTRTVLKALDTTKDIVAFLVCPGTHKGYRRYEFRSGNYTTAHAGDEGLDCGYIKADAIALTAGCWVLAPEDPNYVNFVDDFEAVESPSSSAPPATYAGYADCVANFNAARNFCKTENFPGLYIPRGTFFFKSKPDAKDFPWDIKGAGRQTSVLVRAYDEVSTVGLIELTGDFGGEGVFSNFCILPAHTTTGGHAISVVATSSTQPQNVHFDDLLLTHQNAIGGTWASNRALYFDGTPKNTGTVGIRDVILTNMTVFGRAYFAGVISLTWEGGGIFGGGVTGILELSGVSTVVALYTNINIGIIADGITLGDYVSYGNINVGLLGTSGITNTSNVTDMLVTIGGIFSGTVQTNWTRSSTVVGGRVDRWEHVATFTPSAAASVSVTGLSAYRRLRVTGFLVPATDAQDLYLRTDTNNGASYDAGASDYSYQHVRGVTTTAAAINSAGTTRIVVSPTTVGNAAEEGINFEFTIDNFNQATRCFVNGRSFMLNDTGTTAVSTWGGQRLDATARDAFQLLFASGNIASGQVYVEGLRG
ncbi:hypothetical protein [Mesorhizobium sp. ZC-5]|uniref:hypothetical protein n=1 Tax=Mesorhizobium sp. ZC-5 TaxID=2986066 RepID=UPI0021E89147|nr:hypothetical protein [Mesorhizobium sp. ZC-5]MCV3239683.1 hypothetical protein [Mesorhizobium sp. ZC-5]